MPVAPLDRHHHDSLPPAPRPAIVARSAATDRLHRGRHQDELHVATYNVAGGNKKFSHNFKDRTSDLVAQKLTSGEVNVATLQEVGVSNGKNPGQDYNREILTDVFAQKYCLNRQDVREYYVNDEGREVRITSKNAEEALKSDQFVVRGGTHEMNIDLESYDSQGVPQDRFSPPGKPVHGDDHPVTVYRADDYTIVFGDSGAGGKGYGNSVILGPGAHLEGLEVKELGRDPEGAPGFGKPRDDWERRTALGVHFSTDDGTTGTAISAHLTTESLSDSKRELLKEIYGVSDDQLDAYGKALPGRVRDEQARQLEHLEQFAASFGGGHNTIIGADFNHRPEAGGGFHEPHRPQGIDHIWTTLDLHPGEPRTVHGGDNFSDHDMLIEGMVL